MKRVAWAQASTGAALAAFAALPTQALELTVEVSGARSTRGWVAAALYADGQAWMKQAAARERVAAGSPVRLVFHGLPAGRYALSLFHDENANGELDRTLLGIPTEPYGFSRDARGKVGPPAFDAAAFELQADETLKVMLK
jgi:uncharacterized protein (DUF2141 family)